MIILCVLLLWIIWRGKISLHSGTEDYLQPQMTQMVNGIFILLVFFRHLFQYREFPGNFWQPMHHLDQGMGQFLVVSFLFFSGYGIMESCRSKGKEYIQSIPLRRVVYTWIRFSLCVMVYLAVAMYKGTGLTPDMLLPAFLGWISVGNSNWYIVIILFSYILTWIAFGLARGDERKAVRIHFLLTAVLALFLSFTKEEYWYNTIFTYSAGMLFSVYRGSWEPLILGTSRRKAILGIFVIAAWTLCYLFREAVPAYQLAAILAGFTLCILLRLVQPGNPGLLWTGRHLFGIYMMQRIPMILLADSTLTDAEYFLCCLVLTIVLGWAMDEITKKIARGILK